ncbi:PIG-L deacetylase family protein [Muricoccus pecuniae]|uniref:LmbE family N-acetylglucosaminyl deacetylase n=1 Tax=Muricoccus pecuniae TaxID=693023 RepID=A0A840Y075_9PROT|nr:PIG-L family deacetylase [Roseomonas pecuniae]MBB5692980.1 LmbE family N-acetylglucosaminyl deacetylase [Roseomonas pecuniae]
MGREQGAAGLSGADPLHRIARREAVEDPVALVVAHPDDETLGAGAVMPLFRRLLIIQVTDGAPRNLADARAAGFDSAESYAAAREQELEAALAAGGVRAARLVLGVADQGASLAMAGIARDIAGVLRRHGARAVFTHPYEGGHPDHDATAFCTRAAAGLLGAEAPALIEMPFYHAGPEGWSVGRFLPGGPEPVVLQLDEDERARKRAMIAAFASQAATLSQFPVEQESLRPAPDYDFAAPPHPGTLLYERYGWGMDGARWRALAAEARAALERPA